MGRLKVFKKEHGKAKLFLDMEAPKEWLTGEDLYALMERPGTLYPILIGRTAWKDPIELLDSIAFSVDREFFFE